MRDDNEEVDERAFVTAPCMRCGVSIEDEGPIDDEWYCTGCWPQMERGRLAAGLKSAEDEVRRLQGLYDEETRALNHALRAAVTRERQLEQALRESHATGIDGLVERAAYVACLETALRHIIDCDMTDDYYQRLQSEKLIERPPSWGSPRSIALAALDVPNRKLVT
jgi:hypothetical protein